MRHERSETPAHLVWVEQRPSGSGKGKQAYFEAVRIAATAAIAHPIESDDVEVELFYSTTRRQDHRLDADNVNKPTLDALKGIAYRDDRQVRAVTSTLFDNNRSAMVNGRVEYMGRLFYSNKPDVVLIMVYSESRLAELGGEQEVQRARYAEWQANFNAALEHQKAKDAERQ